MPEVFTVVTEKKARKIIDKGGDVVFIHTRENCPVCDHFLPEVLKPVFSLSAFSSELSLINFFTLLSFLSSSLEML